MKNILIAAIAASALVLSGCQNGDENCDDPETVDTVEQCEQIESGEEEEFEVDSDKKKSKSKVKIGKRK